MDYNKFKNNQNNGTNNEIEKSNTGMIVLLRIVIVIIILLFIAISGIIFMNLMNRGKKDAEIASENATTEEIVTKFQFPGISAICSINNLTYLCSKKGIDEIEYQNIFIELAQNNSKYKNITFIKPINKGYICFGSSSSLYICQ